MRVRSSLSIRSTFVAIVLLLCIRDPHAADWPNQTDGDLTLKKEFESLFDQLSRLQDGFVDIEVRHSLPFRLVLERRIEALV